MSVVRARSEEIIRRHPQVIVGGLRGLLHGRGGGVELNLGVPALEFGVTAIINAPDYSQALQRAFAEAIAGAEIDAVVCGFIIERARRQAVETVVDVQECIPDELRVERLPATAIGDHHAIAQRGSSIPLRSMLGDIRLAINA